MSDLMLVIMEVSFDILYLITIWVLVGIMIKRRNGLSEKNKRIGVLFIYSFFLLALGDTGHVGFRVLAYILGGVDGLGNYPTLVGLGSLATAYTVTVFYMIVLEIWRVRAGKERTLLYWFLIFVGFIRMVIMLHSGNGWGTSPTPYNWSLARNIPLMIQGVVVAVLLLIEGVKNKDLISRDIGIFIFISYAFYTPVILFVKDIPMLGMLMMPKTLAYLAIAFIALKLFKKESLV